MPRILALVALAILLSGCETAPMPPEPTAVLVHVVTDRAETATSDPYARFGDSRGELVFGKAVVSFPPRADWIELPRPSSWQTDDPYRHAGLRCLKSVPADNVMGTIAAAAKARPGGDTLLFVHGFNVGFAESVMRAGQIARFSAFRGPVVVYSWPAPVVYPHAVTNAEWTARHLAETLRRLAEAAHPNKVHVIAHSMGARVLMLAMERLYQGNGPRPPALGQIVLAAPDVDADIFADAVRSLSDTYGGLTVYTSDGDRALAASAGFGGWLRAGDARAPVVHGAETIDVSLADGSTLGHSYYGENCAVMADLRTLLASGKRAAERALHRSERGAWRLAAAKTLSICQPPPAIQPAPRCD